jgi:hypothetical protein
MEKIKILADKHYLDNINLELMRYNSGLKMQ